MSNQELKSQPTSGPGAHNSLTVRPARVTRLEMHTGSFTQRHRHATECLLIVLEGRCRVYLEDCIVILKEHEMLNIPPEQEHVAEALADTVVLSISAASNEWPGCAPVLQNDADQYLWGV